jgi:tRNA-specific 2-thiouridylase
LLDQALALDANYLATGHYARIRQTENGYQLLKGIDETKDQSYVLHVLTQAKLAQTLFPVGEYTKVEVRELARKFNLPVASKHDSQDLCFLSDGDYRRFLRQYNPDSHSPGVILDGDGRTLGQHTGLSFYTIGQRKGLGISAPEPLYVLRKDPAQNALIVGPREQLGQRELVAYDVNWMAGNAPDTPIRAQVKIRYKAAGGEAVVKSVSGGQVHVQFDEPVLGITAGQGAVFYDGDVCLGGGIISKTETETARQT